MSKDTQAFPLSERDLDLIEVALEAAAQACQSGASLRNTKRGLDPLAREYLEAALAAEKLRAWVRS